MALALGAGMLVSVVLFMVLLGPRADLAMALQTWRFNFKIVIAALAVIVAAINFIEIANPVPSRPSAWRWLLPAMLAGGIIVELITTPAASWSVRLVGSNASSCLTFISIFAAAPAVTLMLVMRQGAPLSPARAGAAVGGLAAAAAALLYAVHCFDDSPLFVATWYTLAFIPPVVASTSAGRRLLDW